MIYVLQSLCLHSSLSNEIELMKFRNSKNFDLGLWGSYPRRNFGQMFEVSYLWKGPSDVLISWIIDLMTSPSYISFLHLRGNFRKWKFRKFFSLIFPTGVIKQTQAKGKTWKVKYLKNWEWSNHLQSIIIRPILMPTKSDGIHKYKKWQNFSFFLFDFSIRENLAKISDHFLSRKNPQTAMLGG